jgi:hypothetical protein
MTVEQFQAAMAALNLHAQTGCSNGCCQINPNRGGQHTNASCQCSPRYFSRELLALAIAAEEAGPRWERPE